MRQGGMLRPSNSHYAKQARIPNIEQGISNNEVGSHQTENPKFVDKLDVAYELFIQTKKIAFLVCSLAGEGKEHVVSTKRSDRAQAAAQLLRLEADTPVIDTAFLNCH